MFFRGALLQSRAVITRPIRLARRLLRAAVALVRALVAQWRVMAALALVGALVALGWLALSPTRYRSEGEITIRPRFQLEGHLLSARALGDYHALRLLRPARLDRLARELDLDIDRYRLDALPVADSFTLRLQVEGPTPDGVERVARALLADYRAELLEENRRRDEPDRVIVSLSPASFPAPDAPPIELVALVGALAGTLLALVGALARILLGYGRLVTPLEAERLTGAPTLAAIPGRPS